MDIVSIGQAVAQAGKKMVDWRASRIDSFDAKRDVPGLLAWFDGDDLLGNNGDAVPRWSARYGGFALNVTPATKPTKLASAVNGKAAARFGGAAAISNTDTFGAGGPVGLQSGIAIPMLHAFVFRLSSDATLGGNVVFGRFGNVQVRIAQTGKCMYITDSVTGTINGPELSDGQWHVGIAVFGPGGGATYIDGYLTSTIATGTGSASTFEIGANVATSSPLTTGTLDIATWITAQLAPTPNFISDLTASLAEEYGL